MRIIKSHRALFLKVAASGLVLTAFSMSSLFLLLRSQTAKIDEFIARDAISYAESLSKMAELYADDLVQDAATLLSRHLEGGKSPAEAVVLAAQGLETKGFHHALIWYLDHRGRIHSYVTRAEDIQLVNEFDRLRNRGLKRIRVIYRDKLYMLTYCAVEARKVPGAGQEWFLVAFPGDQLYSAVDREGRIANVGLIPKNAPMNPTTRTPSSISVPLKTGEGSENGLLIIRARPSDLADIGLPYWGFLLLGLLPLLCLLIFGLLVYRYFDSFAAHSEMLKRILKREKLGVEVFSRDHQNIKNHMPELADLFALVDENLDDNAQRKRTLDILGACLAVIGEKGYDRKAAGEVLRLIVNSTASRGAALFSINPGDDSVEVCARHDFSDDLLAWLTQTHQGAAFLKILIQQNSGLHSTDLNAAPADEPWRQIFTGYRYLSTMPLRLRSQDVGLLILISSDEDHGETLSRQLQEMVSHLLSLAICGYSLEQEKASRSHMTGILQETSLAISSTLDLPSVLRIVASRLADYAGATYCVVLLNSEGENVMEVASFFSRRKDSADVIRINQVNLAEFPRLAEGIADTKTLVLGQQDFADFTSAEKSFFRTDTIKRLTVFPIYHTGKSIGLVILGEERSQARAAMPPDKLNFVQALVSQAASAIENARLYGFINQKVDQLTTLYNVSAVIHSEIDADVMIRKVLQATRDYLHHAAAAVFVLDDSTGRLKPGGAHCHDQASEAVNVADVCADSVSSIVASTGKPMAVDDFRVKSNLKPSFPNVISELAVPVKIGNRTIGVFSIGSLAKSAFNQVHESFIKALSAQIAVALERARLFNQERERGLRLKTIFEFSSRLSKSLNLQEVLRTATESIQEAFGYHLVAIFLIDQVNHRFYIGHQSTDTEKQLPSDFSVPLDKGLLGRVAGERKTLYSPDVSKDPDYVRAINDVRSEVCVPVIVADKVVGVLDVESMELDDFAAEDISTLDALADIMAVAMDNSYLFEETMEKAERLALIDNINKAISATLDLDSFFKVVARAVADNAGYRWTLLVVPDGDSFVFKAGYTPRTVAIISPEPILQMLQGRLRIVIESAQPQFVSFADLAAIGRPERLQPILDAGIRNLVLFPIGDPAPADAVMIVGSSRTDGFSLQELSLLKDLAAHLRIAWQNAQLYKQLKTAYEQLQEAQDRVVQTEKLRALGEMSSGVVHDFNNILAAILGRTQIMLKKVASSVADPHQEFLAKNLALIEKAAMDGSQILSRINEFTKKRPTEKFVDLHIDQIIADVIEMTRPRWHDQALEAGKKIDVEFHRSGVLQTTGSPAELREVFTNLLINAIDAISGDGKITIDACQVSDEMIQIVIADNGCGMSEDTRKRIFEPFFTTKGTGGTGLGLPVTYGILSRHNGTIDVESQLGKGSKFHVTLPIKIIEPGSTISDRLPPAGKKQGRILIVDDEREFRNVLTEILISGGHTADSVSGADEALRILRQYEYDIVITDLGMLGLTGWDLADAIYSEHPNVRIIMATGWGAQLEPGILASHHVNSLICKPFKISEILEAVINTLSCPRDEVLVEQA